jgi:hypothetical protein
VRRVICFDLVVAKEAEDDILGRSAAFCRRSSGSSDHWQAEAGLREPGTSRPERSLRRDGTGSSSPKECVPRSPYLYPGSVHLLTSHAVAAAQQPQLPGTAARRNGLQRPPRSLVASPRLCRPPDPCDQGPHRCHWLREGATRHLDFCDQLKLTYDALPVALLVVSERSRPCDPLRARGTRGDDHL